jgi:hypothetical protein
MLSPEELEEYYEAQENGKRTQNEDRFYGTPDFAASSLKMLCEQGHDVCAVFTQPDRPKNRGHKLAMSPVKELAQERGIPVYQPPSLGASETLEILQALRPELIAVVAYGKLLPTEILALPRYGCVNIHGSLLPKYRGAAPIQWSVLNGRGQRASQPCIWRRNRMPATSSPRLPFPLRDMRPPANCTSDWRGLGQSSCAQWQTR